MEKLKFKRTKDLPPVACEPESAAVSHKAQIHINGSSTSYRTAGGLQFKRDNNYKFTWTANSKIRIKKTENSTTKCFVKPWGELQE